MAYGEGALVHGAEGSGEYPLTGLGVIGGFYASGALTPDSPVPLFGVGLVAGAQVAHGAMVSGIDLVGTGTTPYAVANAELYSAPELSGVGTTWHDVIGSGSLLHPSEFSATVIVSTDRYAAGDLLPDLIILGEAWVGVNASGAMVPGIVLDGAGGIPPVLGGGAIGSYPILSAASWHGVSGGGAMWHGPVMLSSPYMPYWTMNPMLHAPDLIGGSSFSAGPAVIRGVGSCRPSPVLSGTGVFS